MRREPDNKYDSRAIALYFEGEKIGFIPREDNVILSGFLDLWYEKFFKIFVNQLSSGEYPDRQVGISVYMKRKKKK